MLLLLIHHIRRLQAELDSVTRRSPATMTNTAHSADLLLSFSRHLSGLRKKLGTGDPRRRADISMLPPEIPGAIFEELRDAVLSGLPGGAQLSLPPLGRLDRKWP